MKKWKSELLDAIVGKLLCERITPKNFEKEKCCDILYQCVLGNKLIDLFIEFETEIKKRLTSEYEKKIISPVLEINFGA